MTGTWMHIHETILHNYTAASAHKLCTVTRQLSVQHCPPLLLTTKSCPLANCYLSTSPKTTSSEPRKYTQQPHTECTQVLGKGKVTRPLGRQWSHLLSLSQTPVYTSRQRIQCYC